MHRPASQAGEAAHRVTLGNRACLAWRFLMMIADSTLWNRLLDGCSNHNKRRVLNGLREVYNIDGKMAVEVGGWVGGRG